MEFIPPSSGTTAKQTTENTDRRKDSHSVDAERDADVSAKGIHPVRSTVSDYASNGAGTLKVVIPAPTGRPVGVGGNPSQWDNGDWIPTFVGMTVGKCSSCLSVPAPLEAL